MYLQILHLVLRAFLVMHIPWVMVTNSDLAGFFLSV